MIVLGIDPGTRTSGVALYDSGAARVVRPEKALDNLSTVDLITSERPDLVVCERVSAGSFSGADYLRTSEVVGMVMQECRRRSIPLVLLYRRDVLRTLGVKAGAGADSRVRGRMIELHGGDRFAAQGTRKGPGPLYGVASHAWQALGAAIAGIQVHEEGTCAED